jgi:DNA-binding GntR family transcriptional regulator
MDDSAALPPYKRIAAQIRERIRAGELRPGDRIPSVRTIIDTENVSSATATRVAAVLREEGLATSVPGVGTVVAVPHSHALDPSREAASLAEELRAITSQLMVIAERVALLEQHVGQAGQR